MTDPDGAPPLVEFVDVSLRRMHHLLLSHVTFSIRPQTVHAVLGPNGAGKSTLLLALLGQAPFDGRIVAHWRHDGRIGYVPQAFAVDASLPVTVEDFLALTRQRRPVCLGVGRTAQMRIAELLRAVGLDGLARRPLSVLSGGELRRVLLAHALDPRPELLVLDEPAAGLDEWGTERLESLVTGLKREGTTVLLVSHDLDQVRRIADSVTVIDRTVLCEGTPSDVHGRDTGPSWLRSERSGGPQ
jgi:zinc transport system ATP-binding protein